MKTWKVTVSINNWNEHTTVYVKANTKDEAYLKTKQYFIEDHSEIDFCAVDSAVEI